MFDISLIYATVYIFLFHVFFSFQSDKIEFGVGPSDSRYFLPVNEQEEDTNEIRPNNLHTRSGFDPIRSQYSGDLNYRYSPNYLARLQEANSGQRLSYAQANDFARYGPSEEYAEPSYELGAKVDYNAINPGAFDYNTLYNEYVRRLNGREDVNTGAFYQRLQEIVASGDYDAARRMLGGRNIQQEARANMKPALRSKGEYPHNIIL